MAKAKAPAEEADELGVLAALDRHLGELATIDKALLGEQLDLEASGIVPEEPSNSQTRFADRTRAYMNGFAPPSDGLGGPQRLWSLIRVERPAVAEALRRGRDAQFRALVRRSAFVIAAHERRIAPIVERTLWLIQELQQANRARRLSCEQAALEGGGVVRSDLLPFSGFELLGQGGPGDQGEASEFIARCRELGIRPAGPKE